MFNMGHAMRGVTKPTTMKLTWIH